MRISRFTKYLWFTKNLLFDVNIESFLTNPLYKKLQLICILTAWLFATGAQWDIAQTFAWANMFSNYSQSMSVGAALKKTFNGKMCSICRAIDEAKQKQRAESLPSGGITAKMIFVIQDKSLFVISSDDIIRASLSDFVIDGEVRVGPPTPPPRTMV